MPYVIKARLSNAQYREGGSDEILFPLSRDDYPGEIQRLGELQAGDAVRQDCMVEEIDSPYEVLQCLRWQAVNVDELDYLARRLESFDKYEVEQFQAACSAFLCLSLKDLINMTFCCQGTTVISDLSKLEEAGKSHYLAIHGGAAPADEMESVDGRALAQELIKSGKGKLTPYGLFFQNGVLLEELYEGHSFPPFPRVDHQAELELTKPDGTKSVIYLPFAESEWDRFLQRENIPDAHECKQALHLYLGQGECIALDGDVAELEEWNKLCDTLSIMPHHRQQAFAAALEVTGAEDPSQMQLLTSSLGDFDFISGIKDAESYGRYMIQKSGKYDYDEALDCYYNFEALGEFLLTHEVGQFTSQGYLKCEEGSAFLDFFTQEVEQKEESIIGKTLRELITQCPDATFHILSPDGYFDFTPEQAHALLHGEQAVANPGVSECFKKVNAEMILNQYVIDGKKDGVSFGLLTDYTPRMSPGQEAQTEPSEGFSMQMGGM